MQVWAYFLRFRDDISIRGFLCGNRARNTVNIVILMYEASFRSYTKAFLYFDKSVRMQVSAYFLRFRDDISIRGFLCGNRARNTVNIVMLMYESSFRSYTKASLYFDKSVRMQV